MTCPICHLPPCGALQTGHAVCEYEKEAKDARPDFCHGHPATEQRDKDVPHTVSVEQVLLMVAKNVRYLGEKEVMVPIASAVSLMEAAIKQARKDAEQKVVDAALGAVPAVSPDDIEEATEMSMEIQQQNHDWLSEALKPFGNR